VLQLRVMIARYVIQMVHQVMEAHQQSQHSNASIDKEIKTLVETKENLLTD